MEALCRKYAFPDHYLDLVNGSKNSKSIQETLDILKKNNQIIIPQKN